MKSNNESITNNIQESEIDFLELFNILFQGKWAIVFITIFAASTSVFYSLSLPNIYQAKTVLIAHQSSKGGSNMLQSVGGLASLAGVSLPSQSADSNSAKAIKKIRTLSFFENNILPNIFLPELMAVESWDSRKNLLKFNNDLYDDLTNTWVRDFNYPKKLIPSSQESFRTFSEHFSISEDKEIGFVTLTIKHQSPYIAKKWAELLVYEINSFYRKKDKAEAERAISYLNEQIVKTNLTEIKQVFASLLQQETQKLMLTQASQSYVYEYLDPPVVMEMKSEPKRSVICIIGTMIGFFLAIIFVLGRHYLYRVLEK
jgi:LPS O-antigen subunit length determinant protein (WzzB/FepE family)